MTSTTLPTPDDTPKEIQLTFWRVAGEFPPEAVLPNGLPEQSPPLRPGRDNLGSTRRGARRSSRFTNHPSLFSTLKEEPTEAPPPPQPRARIRPQFDTPPRLNDPLELELKNIGTVEELKDHFGNSSIKEELIRSVPGQIREVARASSSDMNGLWAAKTGAGKTYVQAMNIALMLDKERRCILFVPTRLLVEQSTETLRKVLDLPEERIIKMNELTPKERVLLHKEKGPLVLVTTAEPFLNDLRNGVTTIDRDTVALFDESHLGRKNHAYAQLMGQFYTAGARLLLFSATPSRDKLDRDVISNDLQLGDPHHIDTPPQIKFESVISVEVDDHIYDVAKSLFNQAALAGCRFIQNLQDAIEDDSGVFAGPDLDKVTKKATGLHPPNFKFRVPTFRDRQAIMRHLDILVDKDVDRFKNVRSKWFEFDHMVFLYETLVRHGKFSFLNAASERLWITKFPGWKKEERREFAIRVYENPEVLKAIHDIGSGTLFENLVLSKTFTQFKKAVFANKEWLGMSPRDLRTLFFDRARTGFVESGIIDHPKQKHLFQLVERHSTFGANDQIIVFTERADDAQYQAEAIQQYMSPVNFPTSVVVGRGKKLGKHSSENLRRFVEGSARLLVGTSALTHGIHTPATVGISISQTSEPERVAQNMGRLGRQGGNQALMYYLVTKGTLDETWFYAGMRRLTKMRQAFE